MVNPATRADRNIISQPAAAAKMEAVFMFKSGTSKVFNTTPDRIENWVEQFYEENKEHFENGYIGQVDNTTTVVRLKASASVLIEFYLYYNWPEKTLVRGRFVGEGQNEFDKIWGALLTVFENPNAENEQQAGDDTGIPVEIKTFTKPKIVMIPAIWNEKDCHKFGNTKKKVLAYHLDDKDWSQSEVAVFTNTSVGNIKAHKRNLGIRRWG